MRAFYQRHAAFLFILLLFSSFRLMALLLFRPGGMITDFSDYHFYTAWGQMGALGYRTNENLWGVYPPLFPALMLPVFELSSRIPPWIEPRLFFRLLFGLELLLFECGNLILIYRLAQKLEIEAWGLGIQACTALPLATSHYPLALHPVLLYVLLFEPLYTLLGWFEPMPLFFLLLGLDLLLSQRRWGWAGSAVAVALGFLIKFIPLLLLPVAVRWLGAKLSWAALRDEWFHRASPGNLLRPVLYTLLLAGTVIGLGYVLVNGNTALALISLRVNNIRPPWQSIWALFDNYYGYGLVPDMRNLTALEHAMWPSTLPWSWISLGFGALYLWLYTRPYNWRQPRTAVGFTGVTLIWLFLYNKGWSPQFLLWVQVFMVLLLPTLRGMLIANLLTFINFIEAYVFLLMLPEEHWLMVGTVLSRTVLLILLLVEFLGQIWPQPERRRQIERLSRRLSWAVLALAVVGIVAGAPRVAQAYQARRLAEHPCRAAIEYLQAEAEWPNPTLVSDQLTVWQDFYPWLRDRYALRVVDGYNPDDRPWATVAAERLAAYVGHNEFWWVRQNSAKPGINSPDPWPPGERLETQQLGDCTVERLIQPPATDLGVAQVAGGPIRLRHFVQGKAQVGRDFHLVLYWQAVTPVPESYTVFTHLVDSAGQVVAQQDNLPVTGLAPTSTWAPNHPVRDPYRLTLPATSAPGSYQLRVGLYTPAGRVTWTLPDGTNADHLTFAVEVLPAE